MKICWLLLLLCVACSASPSVDESLLAPDFSEQTLDETTVTLSKLRGQWVVLNFWATWCIPCKIEMPLLQALATEHPELVVIGMNVRDSELDTQAFVNELSVTFPIVIDLEDSTLLDYQVVGLPQTVLINPRGEIVYRTFGELDNEALLAAMVMSQ